MIRFEMLSEKNIGRVFELEKLCFDDPWTYKMFESELTNNISEYIVGIDEENDEVVSYGGVWLMYDFGDITNIAVHPGYRREGIGKKTLSLLIDICRDNNIERACLEVRDKNEAAIALYENFGFSRDGIRKRYYKNKDDAILMSLKIDRGNENEDTCN